MKILVVLFFASLGCSSGSSSKSPQVDAGQDDALHPTGDAVCTGHTDCDDQDPCTQDFCKNGVCEHTPLDCDDHDLCTADFCDQGTCVHKKREGCCNKDEECDDSDPCTEDYCLSFVCVNRPLDGCCHEDKDCDDNNECTFDMCADNKCSHEKVIGGQCCEKDTDCLDSNPCTKDSCVDGRCVYENAGCCYEDKDCDDNNVCTTEHCTEKQKCERQWLEGCCVESKDCQALSPCIPPACKSNKCEYTPAKSCCRSDEDCSVNDPCIKGVCLGSTDNPGECLLMLDESGGCCVQQVFSADFDDGTLQGMQVEKIYETKVSWVVDSRRFTSPPKSLYFGDPSTHTYDAGQNNPVGAIAWTPEIDLAGLSLAELHFMLFKNTEVATSSDVLEVVVMTGSQKTTIWTSQGLSSSSTGGKFIPVVSSLAPFLGKKVRIGFSFDSKDGFANNYEGVYLDDIRVIGKCSQR